MFGDCLARCKIANVDFRQTMNYCSHMGTTIHYRSTYNIFCIARSGRLLSWIWGAGSRRAGTGDYTLLVVREIRWLFNRRLKVANVLNSVIAAGNSFQMVGAEKLKERLLKSVAQEGTHKRFCNRAYKRKRTSPFSKLVRLYYNIFYVFLSCTTEEGRWATCRLMAEWRMWCLLTDVCGSRRLCRHNWLRGPSVSIPPYLRPIEEESDNEDQLDPPSVDCCNNWAMTSAAGTRDVTPFDRPHNDVIANEERALETSRDDVTESPPNDARQPIDERVTNDVITTGQCTLDEGTNSDVIGKSPSREAHRPITEDDTDRTSGNDVTQHWRLFYVIVASLTAFVACLTSMSPSGFVFIITVMSLIAHHVIQS